MKYELRRIATSEMAIMNTKDDYDGELVEDVKVAGKVEMQNEAIRRNGVDPDYFYYLTVVREVNDETK